MKNVFLFSIIFIFIFNLQSGATPFLGKVEQTSLNKQNTIIDAKTNKPIDGAKVSLPQKHIETTTDKAGKFYLDAQIHGATIMNVEKNGYKPFSITLDEYALSKPLILGIEKSNTKEVLLENNLCHIGDNNFSQNSANANEFRIKSSGASFSKNFKIPNLNNSEDAYLVIGSIIGIDTLMARKIGQSNAVNAYATPPEIYFNGNKISEIQINGDNQEIRLPKSLIRQNAENNITIKAGHNLFQYAYIDYDDIEFMNLYIDYKASTLAGN